MKETERWRRNLQVEIDGAAIYLTMARTEQEPPIQALYRRFAMVEARHARVWAKKLRAAGGWRGMPTPSWRALILIAIARRFGPDIIGRPLVARERWENTIYEAQEDAISALMTVDERSHKRLLNRIVKAKLSGSGMARVGNALRAAVLGVNDGLVSNVSLVMGVAGAGGDTRTIVIAGTAGLLAGSMSMALGEWLSVESSRELYAWEATIDRDEVADAPHETAEEIALVYVSQGMDQATARSVAAKLVRGSLSAPDEPGPDADGGAIAPGASPWVASAASFATFAIGAGIPLLPFAFTTGVAAQVAAVSLTAIVLFGIGSAITIITGRPALRSGLRQLAIGAVATTVTYGLGRLVGGALS